MSIISPINSSSYRIKFETSEAHYSFYTLNDLHFYRKLPNGVLYTAFTSESLQLSCSFNGSVPAMLLRLYCGGCWCQDHYEHESGTTKEETDMSWYVLYFAFQYLFWVSWSYFWDWNFCTFYKIKMFYPKFLHLPVLCW